MFTAPFGGMPSTERGSSLPYAATTKTSGRSARSSSTASGLRNVAGESTLRPCASAHRLSGGAAVCRPRPIGRSGCVYTPAISYAPPASRSSAGTANSGVPMKTTRVMAQGL